MTSAIDTPLGTHSLADYEPLIGAETIERIQRKTDFLRDFHIVNVSSTYYGGGVAELLSPLTLLMNDSGVKTGWRVIQGTPDFFNFTKEVHNGLQGADIELNEEKIKLYEEVVFENASRMHLEDHDFVIVHDPQPLPLVLRFGTEAAWIWQCHVDLTCPNAVLLRYLSSLIERYDAAVLSLPEFAKDLRLPQRFIMPAINPFSAKNREMSENEIRQCLAHYEIPTDLPLVVQVSRFDKWKDPQGVLEAVQIARKKVDCTLVLVGNSAVDDPEGEEIFQSIYDLADERTIVILADDPVLVNALQRAATVVLQKSIREGFGLTVTEAMWKRACVIGGNVGGIRRQIRDGEDGFLVENVVEAAARIVQILKRPELRKRVGDRARETVRQNFLMSRLMEDWIDLVGSMASPSAAASPARRAISGVKRSRV